MATEFNASDYFARQAKAVDAADAAQSPTDRFIQLQKATERSIAKLDEDIATGRKAKALQEQSWAGQLKLDPDGFTARAVNLAASGYAGTSRIAGDIVGGVLADLPTMADDLAITNEETAAVGRFKQGVATPEDIALINTKKSLAPADQFVPDTDEARKVVADRAAAALTPLQRFDRASESRQRGRDIDQAFDRSGVVDQTKRDVLDKELGLGFANPWDQVKTGAAKGFSGSADIVSGVAKLIYSAVEAGVSNPQAATEYIVENLPQLAVGLAGKIGKGVLGASNLGYASENYQKGIAKYQAENKGAYPDERIRQEMAMFAASTALAEQVGDVSLLKGLEKSVKAVTPGLAAQAKGLAKAFGEGALTEGLTEGFQTYAEGKATLTPASAEDIYKGAAVGALVGSGISGAGRVAAVVAGATPEQGAARASQAEKNDALDAAIATGDVAKLVDPKAYTYAPEKAVSALLGNNQLETTTVEQKEVNLKRANEIVADLEQAQTKARDVLAAVDPAQLEGLKTQLAEAQTNGDTDTVALLQETITDVENLDPKELKRMQKNMGTAERRLTEARDALAAFNAESADVDVDTQVASINTPVDASDATAVASRTAATEKIINLAMSSPDRVTPQAVEALVSNTDNGLTDKQRTYLREFTEARLAENELLDMGKVAQRVFAGEGRDVGIKQYRERVTAALAAGNERVASRNIRDLAEFNKSHQAKAQVAQAAWDEGKGTQIQKTAAGQWFVATPEQNLSPSALKKNGGLTMNTDKLVTQIRTEAKAVGATLAELQSAVALKYPNLKVPNVPNVPQAHSATKVQASPSQAPVAARPEAARDSGPGTVQPATKADAPVASEPAAVEATAPVQETGKVAALAENKLYAQSEGKKTSASVRPLVAVADFLSTGFDKAAEFLVNKDLSDKQQNVLDTFELAAKSWMKHLDAGLFTRPDERFFSEDAIQYLQSTEDGMATLDENVKTAMIYAGFSWVAENAARSPFNTNEEINAILQREEDHPVSRAEGDALREVGTRQAVIVNSLGQRAVQALGITAKDDAPADALPRLQSALGVHILRMLEAGKAVERTTITGKEFAELTGSAATDVSAKQHFVKVLYKGAEPAPAVKRIMEANKGTQGVLDKLFGVESGYKEPTFEPVKFTQKTTSGTRQAVPSNLAAIIQKENDVPNYVRQDMWQVATTIDEDLMVRIAGGESVDPRTVHAANQKGREAKNDGLSRELQRMKDFVTSMPDMEQAVYFEHSVWKQQRVGIATNAINPQTSKIHRHMLFRKTWDTKVARIDPAQMENFHLRVAEGLGIKTDKQSNVVSLAKYEAEVNKPIIQEAVAALGKTLNGEGLSRAEQETIATAVGGNGMHGLDALVALAHEARGEPTFNVQLMGEVDGVTNGPMLTNLLLGAASTVGDLYSLLNRGGFYEVGNDNVNYNVWRGSGGKLDLYEQTINNVMNTLASMKNVDQTTLNALYAFTGELRNDKGDIEKAGRNIIKTPLTAMVFGSSVKGAINSMSDNFVGSIYEAIESLQTDKPKMSKDALLDNLSTLGVTLKKDMTNQQLLDYVFDSKEAARIKQSFENTLGKAVSATMKQDFEVFMERRNEFNKAAQASFEIYNSVYQAARQAKIAELIESGEIAVNGKGEPMHGLSPKQEAAIRAELDGFSPVANTAFSAAAGELGAGLALAKSERKLSTEPTYRSTVKLGAPFADGSRSTGVNAFQQVETNPGVGAMVMMIHSSDSAISHTAAAMGEVLNVHDAHGAGLETFTQTAQNLNEATFKTMLNYSPANEMFNSLSRTVEGLAAYIETNGKNMPDGAREAVASKVGDSLMELVLNTKSMAYEADTMRLEALKTMQSVDQYALEGGQYNVTAKDRAEAASRQAELTRNVSEQLLKAIDTVNEFIGVKSAEAKLDTSEMDLDILAAPAQESAFGVVGESAVNSDPKVVEFLKSPRPVKEVIGFLLEGLKDKDSAASKMNVELLKKVRDTLAPSMTVTMVTPSTDVATVLDTHADARGWYVAKDGKEAIYVLSPQFASSGLTAETLLHEMVHGALAKTIQGELDAVIANPKHKSETLDLVNELDGLREKAAEYARENGVLGFDAALENVQEFVAWGMTNRAFQRDVVSKVEYASKTRKNSLVKGMKGFIGNLVGILFKGSTRSKDQIAVNGMTTMINNVSGLFASAGATATRAELKLAMASPMGQAQDLSTVDILNALSPGNVTPEFGARMQGLLEGIVEKIHGPFGSLQKARMSNQAMTPFDVWQKALTDGVAPFASDILASGFAVSQQEAFAIEQVEATVSAALKEGTPEAYQVLSDLFTEAEAKLKPTDFSDPKLYDFVFKIDNAHGGRSDYLARFAALGLANEEFSNLLKFDTERNTKTAGPKSFATRLQDFFEKVLSIFQDKVTKTFGGQAADVKLDALVNNLVDIEAKRRQTLARNATKLDIFAPVEAAAVNAAEAARKKIGDIAASNFFKNSKSGIVQGVSAVARTVANDRVDQFLDGVMQLRDKTVQGRLGMASGLLRDIRGPLDVFKSLLIETKNHERERKAVIVAAAKAARMNFGGVKMTKIQNEAVTATFLRTGAHALLEGSTMADLETLVSDGPARAKAMEGLEQQLDSFGPFKNYFINQANGLGYLKATGRARVAEQMMNAHNIARMAGTPYKGRISEDQALQAEAVIEKLVALYAIDYLNGNVRTQAANVLKAQNARKDGNGVEFLIKLQERLEAESLARLFGDQKALMTHGYTPEIYNPHTSITTATEEDGKKLMLQGYSKGAAVNGDALDTQGQGKRLYVLRDGGLAPRLTGIMSYTGMNAKGSKQHNGYMNPMTADGQVNVTLNSDMAAKKDADVRAQFKTTVRPDLRNYSDNMLVPVINEAGEVANRRYLMEESTKDALLERNNDFADVIGSMAGSIYDKETSQEQNRKAITAARDLYKSQAATQGASYVLVGPRSTDADLREVWRLLPDATKADVKAIWGGEGMYVRNDSLDIMFGYRKLSLADSFRKDPDARNMLEKVFVNVMEHVLEVYGAYKHKLSPADAEAYAKRAAVVVTRGERAWQELVRETKDIIVVKTGVVMMGNIWSNFSLLYLSGVSFKDIAVGHAVALKGATRYQRDAAELAHLKLERDSGYGVNHDRDIARLEDALARNPVKELIDAGLMPTIVEDIAMNEDPFSYKTALTRKVEGVTSKLPPAVTAAAKQIYMAHDTGLYKGLNRITQLSDFVARYTLYQHLINRKKKPLSKEAAILEASDAFINYDIPMQRGMQFMDDMGLTMFTKYFIRIQRILLKIGRENPARVLMAVGLGKFFDLGPIVLDSTALGRIGNNPFGLGPLNYPGTLDQLGTVSAAMALVK